MPLPPCIETERLRLRPRRLEDIDAIVEMDLNPDVYCHRHMRAETSITTPNETALRNSVRSEILSGSPLDCGHRMEGSEGISGLSGADGQTPGNHWSSV